DVRCAWATRKFTRFHTCAKSSFSMIQPIGRREGSHPNMQPDNPYVRQGGSNDDLNSLVGKSLGQFRIVERIGAGGMATVFKAYQPNLDRYVAVKVLPPFHARDATFVKRFVQE